MKMKKKVAISLIVLVVTILVLAIIATTVIIALSNTNIIEQSNSAVSKTKEQQIREAKELMKADGMANGNPASITIEDTILIWDNDRKEVIEMRNGQLIKDEVVIPDGFYYVGGTKDTGLVISDSESDENQGVDYICGGNQFVWIPVEDYSKFVRGTAVKSNTDSNIYKMTGELDTNYYTEPYINAEQWEKDEYNAMCESVKKYQGFYIARFEAGDADAVEERGHQTQAGEIVSKKNAYVYNYVPWGTSIESVGDSKTGGAVYLSQRMYSGSKSVVSTLCYGVQWDAIMNFVSDETHNIVDSTSWGKYSGNIQRCGENETMKAKNIYDLAGNVAELTMEAFDESTTTSARVQPVNRRGHLMYSLIETVLSREIYMAAKEPVSDKNSGRVVRGGNIYYTSYEQQAVYRYNFDSNEVSEGIGFRVALYII